MRIAPLLLLVWGGFAAKLVARDDLPIADFEGETYGDWQVSGTAFGSGPARGTLPNQMPVDGFQGRGLVNSYSGGDGATGELNSPEFVIERDYLAFSIGGGRDPEKLAIRLLVEGNISREATGPNDRPGGSETLAPEAWDVRELAGKRASLRIVDHATGGWGHINIDEIRQTDRPPPRTISPAERVFEIERRYLNLPIKNGARKRRMTILLDGAEIEANDVELADGEADWWAFFDVGPYVGKRLSLRVDSLREDSKALSSIEATESPRDTRPLYEEPLRPRIHFSSRRGWLNDPNGLVFFRDEYHLFYQHNPFGWDWGNMHWGHAVSSDLVHWREAGDVLAPDALGPMFSGSAVVDWQNTSGFGQPDQPPLVLIYTAAGNPTTQCLAWSTDGRQFTKYEGNPVLPQVTPGNRDPKVFWHEPTESWVMTLYVEGPEKRHTIHFFRSPNLRDWRLASVTPGGVDNDKYLFECPDFFPLAVEGPDSRRKWVLSAANGEYAVGDFDGSVFRPEVEKLPDIRGRGYYAAQTFSDIPASDGRRIQIGWLQAPSPGMPFNQAQSIPMELTLRETRDELRLRRTPVQELQSLRDGSNRARDLTDFRSQAIELRAEIRPSAKSAKRGGAPGTDRVEFRIRGATITWHEATQEIQVNDLRAPAPLVDGVQRIVAYVDRTSIELFASDGLTFVPCPWLSPAVSADEPAVSITDPNEWIVHDSLEVYALRSIWSAPAP